MTANVWVRPRRIVGKTLALRHVREDDAAFILKLRTDASKSRFMSPTPPSVDDQRKYIRKYLASDEGVYFIIESLDGEPLGTVRMYDADGQSFAWGSWIIKDGAPMVAGIESALIVYAFALEYLGFVQANAMVHKDNARVLSFHERFGGHRVAEQDDQYAILMPPEAIRSSLRRYGRYLPDPIVVEHGEPTAPSPQIGPSPAVS